MTYTDLTTTADLILAKEPSFKNKTELDLKNLFKTQAKLDLQSDIEDIFRIPVSDLTDYITNNEAVLQDMLALRQLYWYYTEQDGGIDSVARHKAKIYQDLYLTKKSKLKSLYVSSVPITFSKVISR